MIVPARVSIPPSATPRKPTRQQKAPC